jgi:hypothetical protein
MTVAGDYKITLNTPVGPQEGSLSLQVDGMSLSGTIHNAKGATDFDGGTVKGNEVDFKARISTPIGHLKAHVTGTVDGDRFTGSAKLPLGSAQIEGTRI